MRTPEVRGNIPGTEEELDIEADDRLSSIYLPYFEEHPDVDWVMVGDITSEIYGGGKDSQIPGEEAYTVFERVIGEKVHLFGRPIEIGLDGARPTFT